MKQLLRRLFCVCLLASFAGQAIAQSIWTNPITGTNPNTSNPYTAGQTVNTNIGVSGIGRGTGINGSNAVDRYDATGWDAVATQWDDYFTFTLTPNSGFKINLVSFVYTGQASAQGPSNFAFRSSLDGFSANIGTPTATGTTISLSGAAYQNITSAITFRIYGWNANTGTGTFGINDFTFNGTVVAIAPSLTANLGDHPANGNPAAVVGETITYRDTIKNAGTDSARGVSLTNTAPAGTTFNPGSLRTSALARDDNYSISYTGILTSNVLNNDYGLNNGVRTLSIVSFGPTASNGTATLAGTTGSTDLGAPITLNADGSFTWAAPAGFSGTDKFTYIATTGAAGLPNNSAVVTILVAPDISFTTTNVNPSCNGSSTGSITFSASGGSGTLLYSITGAAGSFLPGRIFSGLAANTYPLAVKDANGYIKTGSATLTQPSLVTYGITSVTPTCNNVSNGSITFTSPGGGTGALSFSIMGPGGPFQPSPSFTVLAAGTYTPVAKDANNCTNSGAPITFTNPAALVLGTPTTANPLCTGQSSGSITFNSSGGTGSLTYSITGVGGTFQSSNVFSGLAANTYNLAVKDANGCTATGTATLSNPAAIVVSGTIPQLVYQTAMSNVTFSKTGGAGSPANPWSATGLPPGVSINTASGVVSGTPTATGSFNAIITYTDANGCTGTKSQTVLVGPNIVAETYTAVGNTQLTGGVAAPSTPSVAVSSVATNDVSDAAITYAVVTGPAQGTLTTFNTNGTFLYTPAAGNTTTTTFVYSGTSNGVTTQQTATINFNGRVWYVRAGGAAGDGRSNTPFNTLASAGSPTSAANDFIYVLKEVSGTTPGSIALQLLQQLVGAGATLNVPAASPILTITGNAANTPTLTGTAPATAAITLASNVTATGFNMATAGLTAITNAGTTVTGITINVGTVTTTTGTGLLISGSGNTGAITLASVTTGAAPNGVSVTNFSSPGTVAINGGTITNTTAVGINFSNITAASLGGVTINETSQTALSIFATPLTLTGSLTIATSGGGAGVITSATSSIAAGTNAFSVTNTGSGSGIALTSGSISVTGSNNTISTQTGVALNMTASVTAAGVTFASVSSNGATTGINLTSVNGPGSINIGGGSLTGALGPTFNVSGGNAAVTYSGSITQNTSGASMVTISGANSGNITFNTGTLNAGGGDGLQFDNADGTYNFNGTTTLNGGNAGISIFNGSAGTFNFATTSGSIAITNPSGTAFAVGGTSNSATITYDGNITKNNAGNMVSIVNHTTGTITFSAGNTLSATTASTGNGLQFDNADGTYNFNGTTTLNGGDAGIDILNGSGGAFTFSSTTTITNPSGTAFNIGSAVASSGGGGNVTYNGTITKNTAGRAIEIQNKTGGTVAFNGAISATVSSTGINLASNTGATINFPAGLNLNGAAAAFIATGGGTVTATQNNTTILNIINNTSGTALNVTNTIIGASGLTFRSITSTGGTGTGIILDNTGTTGGGFTITGTGTTAGSGGTIANKTGVDGSVATGCGMYLNITEKVSLSNMNFTGPIQNFGIRGKAVNDFTLKESNFTGVFGTNNTGGVVESTIHFGSQGADGSGNGLTGTAQFLGNNIAGGFTDNLGIFNNNTGSLNMTVTDGTNQAIFGHNATTGNTANDAMIIESRGNGGAAGAGFNLTLSVTNVEFQGARGDMIQTIAASNATHNITILNNTFHNTHPQIITGGGGIATNGGGSGSNYILNYNIEGNSFRGAKSSPIHIGTGGSRATIRGTVLNNIIGVDDPNVGVAPNDIPPPEQVIMGMGSIYIMKKLQVLVP